MRDLDAKMRCSRSMGETVEVELRQAQHSGVLRPPWPDRQHGRFGQDNTLCAYPVISQPCCHL